MCIVDPLLSWIESLISNKSFKFRIEYHVLASSHILCDVPQGSLTIILIYNNEISMYLPSIALQYSDDSNMWPTDAEIIHRIVDVDTRWAADWHM